MTTIPNSSMEASSFLSEMPLPVRTSLNPKASALIDAQVYSHTVVPSLSGKGLMGEPIDELLHDMELFPKRYSQQYQQSLAVLLWETLLLLGFRNDIPDPSAVFALCLTRRDQDFNPLARYRVNNIGHTVWCKVIDCMEHVGLLAKRGGGYKTRDHFSGITTIYEPTLKLYQWLEGAVPRLGMELLRPNQERLLLKANRTRRIKGRIVKQKQLIDYLDDDLTKELRRQVDYLNEIFLAHNFQVWSNREQTHLSLPTAMLDYRRSFNENFQGGGRLYCPAQSLPKKKRKTLIIDGKATVELDYKSHQLRMLYHRHGLEAPYDCYEDPALPRSLMKAATTRVMNCGTKRQAIGSIQKLLDDDVVGLTDCNNLPRDLSAKSLLDAVFNLNPILEQTMSEDLWRELQYLESCIALSVMKALADEGHPCIGIHDSFIVSYDAKDLLLEMMMDKYEKFLGHRPVVSID